MSEIKVDTIGPRVDNGTLTIGASGDTVNIAGTAGTGFPTPTSGIAASAIDSGTIATARLGSGTASSSTFLRGDQTYAAAGGTNTPYFNVYRNGTQSVANTTYVTVQFNAETFDPDNKFDTSNYRFTPAVAGFYFLTAQVRLGVQADGNMYIGLRKSGSTFANALNDNSDNDTVSVSSIVQMSDSEYIDVQFFQATGQTRDITAGAGNTFFTGYKIIT